MAEAERRTLTLRVQPHLVGELADAYDHAVEQMRTLLADIRDRARLPEPWTHDEVTVRAAEIYHHNVLDGPNSAYAALRLYEAELMSIRGQLRAAEAAYLAAEGANAELWERG